MRDAAEEQAFAAERLTGLGGSDAASLLNIGWGCRRRLWYEKRNVEPDYKREENAAMELGQVLDGPAGVGVGDPDPVLHPET